MIAHLIKIGARPYWINPDEKSIGTRLDLTDSYRRQGYLDEEFDLRHGMQIGWDDMGAGSLNGSEFTTAVDRRERASVAWIERMRRQQIANEERLQREAAEAEERYGSMRAWLARKEEPEAEEYERLIQPGVLNEFSNEIGDIEIELPTDRGIWMHPATWHAILFRERIKGRVGRTFTFGQMCHPFIDSTRRKDGMWEAMTEYLFHLYRRGYVRFSAYSHHIGDEILVVADTVEGAREARGW